MWRATGSMYPTGSPAGVRVTFDTFVRPLPEWRDPEPDLPFDNHAIIVCSSCLGFENGLPALTIRLIVHTVGVRRVLYHTRRLKRTVSYETSETIRLDLDDQQSSLDLIGLKSNRAPGQQKEKTQPGGIASGQHSICASGICSDSPTKETAPCLTLRLSSSGTIGHSWAFGYKVRLCAASRPPWPC